MSVLIHPTVSQSLVLTSALEAETGMTALLRINGRQATHALMNKDGTAPKLRATPNPKLILIDGIQNGDMQ